MSMRLIKLRFMLVVLEFIVHEIEQSRRSTHSAYVHEQARNLLTWVREAIVKESK